MIGKNDFARDDYFKATIQGGLDCAFGASGFYVGHWNSSNWLDGNSIEMDFYGGYKFKGDWHVPELQTHEVAAKQLAVHSQNQQGKLAHTAFPGP